MLAFDGYRTYGGSDIQTAIKICGIVACTKAGDLQSCAIQSELNHLTLEKVELKVKVTNVGDLERTNSMANTLTKDLKPLNARHFGFNVANVE